MHIPLDCDPETNRLLIFLGAEPLDGSGFEEEIPDSEFSTGDEE